MKKNWPMRIASILLCLVLFTTCLVSGLYARYSAKGTSYDSARVIKFGDLALIETGDFVNANSIVPAYIIPGINLTKDIHIEFEGSEAATYVFVELFLNAPWQPTQTNKNHPDYLKEFIAYKFGGNKELMRWKIKDEWTVLKSASNETNSYVYYLELAPNTSLSLDFIDDVDTNLNNGTIIVSDQINKNDLSDYKDNGYTCAINIKAYVVQANGFADVDKAWKSLPKY